MAVFYTESFRTKAPHDDPRISVRLLKELEWHSFNGDGSKDILTVRADSRVSGRPFTSKSPDVILRTIPYRGVMAVF